MSRRTYTLILQLLGRYLCPSAASRSTLTSLRLNSDSSLLCPGGVAVGDISVRSSSPTNERFEKQHNPSVTSYITNCFVNNLWYHLSNDHHGGLSYGVTAGRTSIRRPVGPRWFRQAELWPPRDDFPFVTGQIVALPRSKPGICGTCWVLNLEGRVLKAAWKEKASVHYVVWVMANGHTDGHEPEPCGSSCGVTLGIFTAAS